MRAETFGVLVEPWGLPRREPDWPSESSAAAAREADSPAHNEIAVLEPSDALVVEAISKGERDALAILFRRYARMVRRVAERILRSEAEADDLVQEVFLFVFQKANLFDPGRGSARTWLAQVTYHRALDRRRYLTSRGFYSHCELDEALLELEDPQTRYDDAIEAVLGREALDRIDRCLSDMQRRVLDLRFVQGCTIDEIAGILGQSAGNVRNHYYRALERIRREVFGRRASGKERVASG